MSRLDEIRERASKATKGEWMVVVKGNTVQSQAVVTDSGINVCSGISPKRNDAAFIAHSKSDIEYLLSEIDRLKAGQGNEALNADNICNALEEYRLSKTVSQFLNSGDCKHFRDGIEAAILLIREIVEEMKEDGQINNKMHR